MNTEISEYPTFTTHRRPSSLSFLLVISCFHPTVTTSGAPSSLSSPMNPRLIIGKYSLTDFERSSIFPRTSNNPSPSAVSNSDFSVGVLFVRGVHGNKYKSPEVISRCQINYINDLYIASKLHVARHQVVKSNINAAFCSTPSRQK